MRKTWDQQVSSLSWESLHTHLRTNKTVKTRLIFASDIHSALAKCLVVFMLTILTTKASPLGLVYSVGLFCFC